MSSAADRPPCDRAELLSLYAMHALDPSDVPPLEAHLATCAICREELDRLRPITDFFGWPADALRPSESLWERLARRVAAESGVEPIVPTARQWSEPEWEEAAPGIACKLLATDTDNDRVSMLVRLAPGAAYPPHRHSGTEELYLLHGELWIDDRKLYPGDYNEAKAGTSDKRVWTETGCTCVLITSPRDVLS